MPTAPRAALTLVFVSVLIGGLADAATAPVKRTVPGDLCATAVTLARGEHLTVDLCQAWNDYDPGVFGCTASAMPGPDVVAKLDTQAGERVHVTITVTDGVPDVRLYLATDCEDIENTCIAAVTDAASEFEVMIVTGGTAYLVIDSTSECGTVELLREQVTSTVDTTFSALKAVYR